MYRCLQRISCGCLSLAMVLPSIALSSAHALDASVPLAETGRQSVDEFEIVDTGRGEIGIEIGALTFLGADIHFYYRPSGSPWSYGWRYLEFEDDFFINVLDLDDSDRETQRVAGPFVRYLVTPERNQSFYLSGALYRVTQKIECELGDDEDSASGLFMGGGLMVGLKGTVGYNVGLMFAPGLSLDSQTPDCSSETDGYIDANLSIGFRF